MHWRVKSLVGQRYGMLVVLELSQEKKGHEANWLCRCDCGVETSVLAGNLRRGRTTSCGCRRTKHGESPLDRITVEYRTWRDMIERCHGSHMRREFEAYRSRGIAVCGEWRASYEAFLAHVGRRPGRGYSLDRIDNDRGYEPGNVRWATRSQQQLNKSNTTYVNLDGKRVPMALVAKAKAIPQSTVTSRLARGWSPEQAVELETVK